MQFKKGYCVFKGALKDGEICNLIAIVSKQDQEMMMSSFLGLKKRNQQAIHNSKLIRNRVQEMFSRASTMIMNSSLSKRAEAMRRIRKAHKEVLSIEGSSNG